MQDTMVVQGEWPLEKNESQRGDYLNAQYIPLEGGHIKKCLT